MRVAPYLLSAILLSTMLGAAQAEPGGLEGSWSGSGTAKLRNRVDRIVCRVSFARIEQKSFRVSSFCSMGDRRYEQSGRVSSVGGNRYTGWVFNEQFNERGSEAREGDPPYVLRLDALLLPFHVLALPPIRLRRHVRTPGLRACSRG